MDSMSLSDPSREHLKQVGEAHSGRSAHESLDARHSMDVDEDSVVQLTVAKRP